MKEHRGMRPHDIAVLLKIVCIDSKAWLGKDLAAILSLSGSEVSESVHRSVMAGLLGPDGKRVMKQALLEFLEFGLKYVFPVRPGGIMRGMASAHSAPPLVNFINSDEVYVWPFDEGDVRGESIRPLYPGAVQAARKDAELYAMLALADVIRIGRARERVLAMDELRKRIG